MEEHVQANVRSSSSAAIVIFGATGDLSKRKLFPALFSLYKEGLLSKDFAVIGVGRQEKTSEEFRKDLNSSITEFSRYKATDENEWHEFASHFEYYALDVSNENGYAGLNDVLTRLDQKFNIPGNRVFYLAMAPNFFGPITLNLKTGGLTQSKGWKRLVIEKPFGHDYQSAKELNNQICQVFKEDEIYRIDHYLGKEMVQNITVVRFANMLFESVWNNRYIANVQITSSETVGVEQRGDYYEKSGALRDMVQNHMLQMVTMIAMEPPSRLKNEAIRDEKVKVMRSLRRFSPEEVQENVIRAQYTEGKMDGKDVAGYRNEPKVSPSSVTETYVAAKLFVDNFRWAGVPFYIRTGKRMASKSTEIVIQFKDMPKNLYFNRNGNLGPNLLVIRIHPSEGMYLQFNAKKPGTEGGVIPIEMEFCHNTDEGSPEAYEHLIHDCLEGDSTYFTRWDEVSLAWKFVDPIAEAWRSHQIAIAEYPSGSWGPEEADELLAKDGYKWWPVHGQYLNACDADSKLIKVKEVPDNV